MVLMYHQTLKNPAQGKLPEKTEADLATEKIEQGKGLYLLERTGFDQGAP